MLPLPVLATTISGCWSPSGSSTATATGDRPVGKAAAVPNPSAIAQQHIHRMGKATGDDGSRLPSWFTSLAATLPGFPIPMTSEARTPPWPSQVGWSDRCCQR